MNFSRKSLNFSRKSLNSFKELDSLIRDPPQGKSLQFKDFPLILKKKFDRSRIFSFNDLHVGLQYTLQHTTKSTYTKKKSHSYNKGIIRAIQSSSDCFTTRYLLPLVAVLISNYFSMALLLLTSTGKYLLTSSRASQQPMLRGLKSFVV